jgi:hypothetical protein
VCATLRLTVDEPTPLIWVTLHQTPRETIGIASVVLRVRHLCRLGLMVSASGDRQQQRAWRRSDAEVPTASGHLISARLVRTRTGNMRLACQARLVLTCSREGL